MAATAAYMDTSAATTAHMTAAASAATMAATKGQSLVLGERWRSGVFFIEDIKRRQAYVGDFLLTKKDFVAL